MSISRRIVLLLTALLALAACGESEERGPVVLAPSSMQEAIDDAAQVYAATGRPRPVLSFAGTPTLARQIELGAPADIFISADERWMDLLEERGLVRGQTRRELVLNGLVLVRGKDIEGPLWGPPGSLAAVVGNARLAMADPQSVPAGRYAREALEALGEWDVLADQVVPTENVRAAAALVERGEVDYAIVYATDQIASSALGLVGSFPEEATPRIVYPAAEIESGTSPETDVFLDFLESERARTIFARHGFRLPVR